jgi:hypothetical protein
VIAVAASWIGAITLAIRRSLPGSRPSGGLAAVHLAEPDSPPTPADLLTAMRSITPYDAAP